jgi:hypothetical protein
MHNDKEAKWQIQPDTWCSANIFLHCVKKVQSAQTDQMMKVLNLYDPFAGDAVYWLYTCYDYIITSSVVQNDTMMCGVVIQTP